MDACLQRTTHATHLRGQRTTTPKVLGDLSRTPFTKNDQSRHSKPRMVGTCFWETSHGPQFKGWEDSLSTSILVDRERPNSSVTHLGKRKRHALQCNVVQQLKESRQQQRPDMNNQNHQILQGDLTRSVVIASHFSTASIHVY